MATFTASIVAGSSHPNDGGIHPRTIAWLSENDRPAWVLERKSDDQRTWIPTVEDMLEDGLLLVLAHGLKLPELRAELPSSLNETYAELYDVDEAVRKQLYEACRKLPNCTKVVVTVLSGSTILRQLPVLDSYNFDVEVCTPAFVRAFSRWSERTHRWGSLQVEPRA